MKICITVLMAIMFVYVCRAQNTTTNLEDNLDTKVELNAGDDVDIQRLSDESAKVDRHKRRHTNIKALDVPTFNVRRIRSVRPVSVDGKTVDRLYVGESGKRRGKRHVQAEQSDDILLQDLSKSAIPVEYARVFGRSVRRAVKEVRISKFQKSKIFAVDASQYRWDGRNAVKKELSEMKTIADFERPFQESYRSSKRLNDIKSVDRQLYLRWIDILKASGTNSIEHIRPDRKRKIVGEAWIAQDFGYTSETKANMKRNLEWLKAQGYDTVLVRFSCEEDKNALTAMMADIKESGFDLFAVYVGLDNQQPAWNPFIDPDRITEYVRLVAPLCNGFFLNWRSTSNHVRLLPVEYFNWLCMRLREANPSILIYGEIYYGRIDALKENTLAYMVPENITGVVINNVGFYGNNIAYIVNNMFATAVPGYRKLDKIGQVVGVSPYYCSRPDRFIQGLTPDKEYLYKARVEKAFKRVGAGTVTFIHDGIEDNYTNIVAPKISPKRCETTDNILYDRKLIPERK